MIQWIGWLAGVILLATIARQVWTQWRSETSAGVSKWLFAGQTAASICFIVYSIALGDAVFIATNSLMLAAAVVGQAIYWRNGRKAEVAPSAAVDPKISARRAAPTRA
jgi:MtN3 and saliva related transmembrane protein